ncbi:unnamed protein product [Bursaphelenchus okinawaensis]|uniref:HTH_48 domain-containing protein n=1 Tax=Bursaphelenchus okinawaensis TaxID=465554 RepID=A0A811LLA4_9BILA|nr:unnamed protein product [Bursaphelenchus okinawaensis]CAG9125214.1 unnamed protein product [Bursaphelenchus okinawaensis]
MDKKLLRPILLYEYKNGLKAAETARSINEAFGPETVKERTVRWWFKKFKNGCENLEDVDRTGRPTEFNNNMLIQILDSEPGITSNDLAERLKVTRVTVKQYLRKIGRLNEVETAEKVKKVPDIKNKMKSKRTLQMEILNTKELVLP